MKNIELTEEYKSKLLEMCENLFPEYKFTLEENCQLGAYSYTFNSLVFSKLDEKDHLYKGEEIHWFEFCIFYLGLKIFENNEDSYDDFLLQITNSHPIDYLYKKFKVNV